MDSAFITVLSNAGVAGVVVILMIFGWLVPKPFYTKLEEENRQLRAQAEMDRQRGDEAEQAGRVTNQLITALTDIAADRQRALGPSPKRPDLTWEDLR